MLRKTDLIALTALLVLIITGCSNSSYLDNNRGRSFETAKFNQTLNPNADKNLAPVEGMEGIAAERILEGHIKGGGQKEKPSSGIGILNLQN